MENNNAATLLVFFYLKHETDQGELLNGRVSKKVLEVIFES